MIQVYNNFYVIYNFIYLSYITSVKHLLADIEGFMNIKKEDERIGIQTGKVKTANGNFLR